MKYLSSRSKGKEQRERVTFNTYFFCTPGTLVLKKVSQCIGEYILPSKIITQFWIISESKDSSRGTGNINCAFGLFSELLVVKKLLNI